MHSDQFVCYVLVAFAGLLIKKMKNKLLSEISEALKTSEEKVVTDTHISVNNNGYEYHIYKCSLKDLHRLAYLENCLQSNMYMGVSINKKKRIKLAKECIKLHQKTNWLYNKQ